MSGPLDSLLTAELGSKFSGDLANNTFTYTKLESFFEFFI